MKSLAAGMWHWARVIGLLAAFGPLNPAPLSAQDDARGWRALCISGNEVEILVGSPWYRSIVLGPKEYGEDECGVLNTSYTGHENAVRHITGAHARGAACGAC